MSMQMDAEFQKEQNGTLFVWVGALGDGYWGGGGGQGSPNQKIGLTSITFFFGASCIHLIFIPVWFWPKPSTTYTHAMMCHHVITLYTLYLSLRITAFLRQIRQKSLSQPWHYRVCIWCVEHHYLRCAVSYPVCTKYAKQKEWVLNLVGGMMSGRNVSLCMLECVSAQRLLVSAGPV